MIKGNMDETKSGYSAHVGGLIGKKINDTNSVLKVSSSQVSGTYDPPEPEPQQQETPQEESQSENTDQSSNDDNENNNR